MRNQNQKILSACYGIGYFKVLNLDELYLYLLIQEDLQQSDMNIR